MSGESYPADPPDVWAEAALVIQAEHDADIRLEARGLAVAEMADVSFTERLAALAEGQEVTVLIRGGTRLSGRVIGRAIDHVTIGGSGDTVVPAHAIASIIDAPRVLHIESEQHHVRTWRSVMRDWLGEAIDVRTSGVVHSGHIRWIGKDHLSIRSLSDAGDHAEITIVWEFVDAVTRRIR